MTEVNVNSQILPVDSRFSMFYFKLHHCYFLAHCSLSI